MWGICLDISVHDGMLFQRAVEYESSLEECSVHILQPVSDIIISIDKIKPVDREPVFVYGEIVSPVTHSGVIGEIADIVWHFKNDDYNYYISVNGKKKSKRYYSDDLLKLK